MAPQGLAPMLLAAILAAGEPPASLAATGAVHVPWIGNADWTMTLDAEGRVAGTGKRGSCSATAAQQAELTRLLSALPVAEPEYRFGEGNADTHARFTLTIRQRGVRRTYSYWECHQEPCRDQGAIDSIQHVWTFLRGLCRATAGGTS